MKWSDFGGKGRRLTQTLAAVASENSMKGKAAPTHPQAFHRPRDREGHHQHLGVDDSAHQTVGDVYQYFHERHGPARIRAESTSMTQREEFTVFRDAYCVQTYCTPKARVRTVDRQSTRPSKQSWRFPQKGKTTGGSCRRSVT